MDIREAKYLLEIEKTRQLTKAAKSLHLTQPALSRVLKKLEEEFEDPLFLRGDEGLYPTPVGKIVLKYSANIVREFSEMEMAVSIAQEKRKTGVRVGIPLMLGYLFSPLVATFGIQNPSIDLEVIELGGNEALEGLRNGSLDVAFPVRPISDPSMNEHIIFRSEIAVGIDVSHPWAEKDIIVNEDFKATPFVTAERSWQLHSQLEQRLHSDGIESITKYQGKELATMMGYAKVANIPIVLPEPALKECGWPTMAIRRFMPMFPWELCVAYPKRNSTKGALRTFVYYVLDYFAAHAGQEMM